MKKNYKFKYKYFTKILILLLISMIITTSCNRYHIVDDDKLYVYNWGLYIDEQTILDFEKETGIKVVYDMFDTNEEMYAIINSGSKIYDVLCPTDYMIEKMISKNMIYQYDYSKLDNFKNLNKDLLDIMKSFDKDNNYAVPYVYSTIGIIYNKTILDEKHLPYPTKWADLWKEEYRGEILMQDALRDLLMVGLKKNNYSLNSLDENEINKACEDLIIQKPLVNAYVIDQVRDKMVLGEGSIAVTYSGEVEYISSENQDNEYVYILPEEGVNLTIDAWVIPENAKHKDKALKWIDFMNNKEIALKNFEYMHYGIPNLDVINDLDDKYKHNEAIFPDLSDKNKYELYKDIGEEGERLYEDAFKKIKS